MKFINDFYLEIQVNDIIYLFILSLIIILRKYKLQPVIHFIQPMCSKIIFQKKNSLLKCVIDLIKVVDLI